MMGLGWLVTLWLLGTGSGDGLDGLAWMAGSWGGEPGGVEMEEHWTAPKGGSLLGLHRDVAGGRTVSFEFLRIAASADGIVYWASPQGRPPTPFRLVESKDGRAVFENPGHDFPQRILYWLAADGSLHARIEGMKGEKAQEWAWRRVGSAGRARGLPACCTEHASRGGFPAKCPESPGPN